ncbi:MAG: DUF3179 domain-containing protein [Actinobacteria bacterium]|nr:DUF3179 domain-containing protein [Actinomycetota bacterium]
MLATACTTSTTSTSATSTSATSTTNASTSTKVASGVTLIPAFNIPGDPPEGVPSALDDRNDPRFPEPLIDPDRIRSGGPPPDGIPPIDDPRFVAVAEVDFLQDNEPVLAFQLGDDARAYPLQILTWHEIVNDTVNGVPVSITYCPLCNSAVAYDRRLDDRVLTFGTSGKLYNSALVMYDRQTESLWSHFTGQAVIGFLAGQTLETHPVATVGWGDWRAAHPDGLVLSTDTGFSRNYGRNPYPGYDDINTVPFLFDGDLDGRLAAKERVIGIHQGTDALAITTEYLAQQGVIEVTVEEQDLTVWHQPGTASALEGQTLADGRDVGATGVFVPVVNQQNLHFTVIQNGFTDAETSSTWNILGQATAGPLQGTQLQAVEHVDTFWFAWGAFRPETRILP